MVAHRKNLPPGKAYVPSSWFIVLTVMVLIGGAGWLGWLLVDDDSSAGASPTASASPTTAEPTTSEPAKTKTTPATPTPTKSTKTPTAQESTPEPTPTAASRTATVSVLNNSGVRGAARAFSAKVGQAGWRLGGIGNWTGSIDGNTVYYAPGLQQQAQLLANDVGIARIRPSVAPMRMDRLTVILSGPQ